MYIPSAAFWSCCVAVVGMTVAVGVPVEVEVVAGDIAMGRILAVALTVAGLWEVILGADWREDAVAVAMGLIFAILGGSPDIVLEKREALII